MGEQTAMAHDAPNTNDTDVVRSLLHQAARAYATNGVAIFPCRPRDKRPLTAHGFKDATVDLDQIDRWWQATPDANIGIALGANHMFALDVDGPTGRAALDQLETTYQPLPDTYQVITGRTEGSGRHHIFRQPDGPPIGNRQIGDHLETRGDGGYVVAAPSVHPSGRSYEAAGRWSDIVDAPGWLIHLARTPQPTVDLHARQDTTSPALRRLEAVCAKVVMAPEGTRNNILNWAAYRAGQSVGARQLDPDTAADMLLVAAQRAGLDIGESAATIQSGMTAGAADPDTPDIAAQTSDTPTVTTLGTDWATVTSADTASTAGRGAWQPADLTDILDGTYEPPRTTVLTRTDGFALLYPGTTNAIFGESESGKSWVALHACAQQILAGQHVLYLDFEATAAVTAIRLAMLGVPADAILAQFHYIAPDTPLNQDATDQLRSLLADRQPTLAVLDGITGAMGLHGWNPLDNADAEQFDRLLPRALAHSGPAVLMVDHVPKSREADAKYAMGAQHKRAAISGAAYRVDVLATLAPGAHGRLKVSISKDRHGTVRGTHPTQAGVFHLDSSDPDAPRAQLEPPSHAPAGQDVRPTYLMEQVSRCLETSPDELNQREVLALVDGKTQYVRKALAVLVEEGYVAQSLAGQKHLHRSVKPYRDEEKSL